MGGILGVRLKIIVEPALNPSSKWRSILLLVVGDCGVLSPQDGLSRVHTLAVALQGLLFQHATQPFILLHLLQRLLLHP